jgi:hypothetical protein
MMRRWGIRLIGIFFLFWAISNLFGLIEGIRPPRGFMGIDLGITYNGESIGIMAWIGVCVLAYTGLCLLMLNPQGHKWALILLWLSVLKLVLALVLIIILSLKSQIVPTSLTTSINYLSYSIKIDKSGSFLAITGISFLFYAIQIYFLMRNEVKTEFQRQETLDAKPEQGEV